MTRKSLDVVALGNALMDIVAPLDDAALDSLGIAKNAMTLIDDDRAAILTDTASHGAQSPGGSACNTLAGLASAGAKTGFMGKLARDSVGDAYATALDAAGIAYTTPRLDTGGASGRSIIFVSPDGARSMNTLLGASTEFSANDVNADLIASAQYLYLEGYLFDKPEAKTAFLQAAEIAKNHGTKTVLTLSDAFCVERHRDDFKRFIAEKCDVVFGNEAEVTALYETDDLPQAATKLAESCEIAIITRGADGASIYHNGEKTVDQTAYKTDVIDTTGAGDQFAAGVLFGLCRDKHLAFCAEYGARAAAEVISHYGARPHTQLSDVFADIMV